MSITDEIAEQMRNKTSEELIGIWTKNDRTQWSDVAFEAIKQVLAERGTPLPQQGSRPVQIPTLPSLVEDATKRSNGFLWWGGFVVVSFLFGPGKAAFSSGMPTVILASMAGLSLSVGICATWYWLSGIRARRSLFPRIFGTIFFVLGSMFPVIAFVDLVAPSLSGKTLVIRATEFLFMIIIVLVFLAIAYLLMFRRNKKADK